VPHLPRGQDLAVMTVESRWEPDKVRRGDWIATATTSI